MKKFKITISVKVGDDNDLDINTSCNKPIDLSMGINIIKQVLEDMENVMAINENMK